MEMKIGDIVERLREQSRFLQTRSFSSEAGALEREAADMIQFFFSLLQMHSPDMGGQHSYRFRSSGWPMTHCKGPNAEEAVKAAMKEVERAAKS